MTTPNKPTPEELQASIDDAIALEAELNANPNPEPEDPEPIDPETPQDPEPDPEKPNDDEPPVLPEDKEEEDTPPDDNPDDELKKKLSASARENQKIYAKNRVINQALVDADSIPAPTDEEMKAKYGDQWDLYSDAEKEEKVEIVLTKKWREKIKDASDQASKIEKWNESVDQFVDDPQTLVDMPDLEGKTDDFKEYASNPENNSVPFKLLVSAFLHDVQTKRAVNKGKMFIRAKGGSNQKPQAPQGETFTLEQSRILRETDYPTWKEKLMEGKIKTDI